MSDLLSLSARDILSSYASGSFSPSEYMRALVERVDAVEPKVAALYLYRPEQALAEADASTARWKKGEPVGPLDGLPISIKEMIATKGDPVPNGTAAVDLVPEQEDAPAAARLREDGAIFFAKTTAPDYGMLSSGLSSFHHLSRNPWDLGQNPGGSSAGAGAAGAAGYGPVHMGTDIGGSIRIPAAWCGLFGFKPTQGRVPVYPYYPGRCHGPMSRTVDDSLVVMETLTRPDARDATSVRHENLDWNVAPESVKGRKIGLMLDAGCGIAVDPEVRAAIEAAARRFEAEGAEIVELSPFMTPQMLNGVDAFWQARFWSRMRDMSPERRAKILPFILEWAASAKDYDGASVAAGFDQMLAIRDAGARALMQVEAILSPVNPIVGFPAEWAGPTNDPKRSLDHIGFTMPWNMGDQPACSVHCGFSSSGMPIGLQIVANRFEDLTVLGLARAYESWVGPITEWPEL
ncbi:amidase [Stappia sp.]|jgi:aspartyl-tRNA(Asn)/glutamyl-tRNA(Gln) amidotransferase subunit A|uniref:amidase n=1 Tax=Stappia sp. TaxID=1870903 RepID=UPI003A99496F